MTAYSRVWRVLLHGKWCKWPPTVS